MKIEFKPLTDEQLALAPGLERFEELSKQLVDRAFEKFERNRIPGVEYEMVRRDELTPAHQRLLVLEWRPVRVVDPVAYQAHLDAKNRTI